MFMCVPFWLGMPSRCPGVIGNGRGATLEYPGDIRFEWPSAYRTIREHMLRVLVYGEAGVQRRPLGNPLGALGGVL